MKNNKIYEYLLNNTDQYFFATKEIINKFGDAQVVYAFFLRADCLYAPLFVLDFLNKIKQELNVKFKLYEPYQEGDLILSNLPLFFIEGYFKDLVMLETLILQRIGYSCISAYNAYKMSLYLPKTIFISMGARHYSGYEMSNMVDYGVYVGAVKAKKEGCLSFIGSSTKAGSEFFGINKGIGTMPHALIGYAGSTLKAAEMYYETFKPKQMVVLIDYFGKELTDTIELCKLFENLAKKGDLSIRLDTNGSRYIEGLNEVKSKEIIKKYIKNCDIKAFEQKEDIFIGKGVSAAAIFKVRETLDLNGFDQVKIVVSSGFNLNKCLAMSEINAPIDVIGTGSIIGDDLSTAYATSDIISYNNKLMVKKGREYLIDYWEKARTKSG